MTMPRTRSIISLYIITVKTGSLFNCTLMKVTDKQFLKEFFLLI